MPKKRYAVAVLAAGLLITAGAGSASAHVHVIPDSTAAGSYTKLTFRVPDESPSAQTVKVAVSLPLTTPLADVSAQPLAGWTLSILEGDLPKPVQVEGATLTKAPVKVTWTATGSGDAAGIAPGQFQEFSIDGGPIPEGAKQLAFPVAQTYSDGTVVQWNQPQPPGSDEPEHPLPAFAVTPAVPGADDDQAVPPIGVAAQPSTQPAASTAAQNSAGSGGWATGLGTAGLVAGLLGLALGAVALRRTSRV